MSAARVLKLRDWLWRIWADHARDTTSLKGRAIRGSVWTVAGHAARQSIRLAKNVALAWLLFPEAFGLMALVAVVIEGLNMLSDVGIGPSVIQNKRGIDRAFLNTAFTIQIIRGVALWLAACILAVPVAWAFAQNDPMAWQLAYILPVAAFECAVRGLESPGLLTLNRELRIGRLTVLELICAVISALVMIAWALVDRSVWALVAGSLVGAVAKAALSYRMVPQVRVWPQWDSSCAREIYAFGKWIFLSTLITFLAMQADRLLLGGLVPIEMLGVYSFGVMLAMMPRVVIGKLSARVLFPALAENRRRSPDALGRNLLKVQSYVLPPAMLMVLGVILLAPAFFETLYDQRYHDAGWIAQLSAIGVWIYVLGQIAGSLLLASGRPQNLAASNLANLIATVVGCLLGYHMFGLPGFILGYAAGNLAGLLALLLIVERLGISIWLQDARYTIILAVVAGVGLVLPHVAVFLWPSVLPQIWCQVIVGAAILAVVSIWTAQKTLLPRKTKPSVADCNPLPGGSL